MAASANLPDWYILLYFTRTGGSRVIGSGPLRAGTEKKR